MGGSLFAKNPSFSVGGSTILEQRTAALASNDSNLNFTEGLQSAFSEADLAWQTTFHHDDVNGLVHLMGKPANSESAWAHEFYNVATSSWTVISQTMWNNYGHIYGNFAMDYATGDLYQSRSTGTGAGTVDNPLRVRHFIRANGLALSSWGVIPTDRDYEASIGGAEAHANGVAYHPNLYGTGDGGLLMGNQTWIYSIRKSTNVVQKLSTPYMGDKEGAGCYWPAQNAAFIGGSGGVLMRVTPNATAGGTPVVTSMGTPPIDTAGHSHLSGSGFGSLHVHPGNPNKLLILETAGQRVYESTNGSTWTQVGNHPFNRVPRVVCSLRGNLGCFWAIGRDGSGNFSHLWRPPV